MSIDDPYSDITPHDSPKTFSEVFEDAEFVKLAIPELSEGEMCVDFDLPVHDFSTGVAQLTGGSFHLKAISANQPVALIFGSYT